MENIEEQIQAIEQHNMRSLPAQHTRFYDGWLLRFNQGYTRRANSVQPMYAGGLPLEEKLRRTEQMYADHHLPTVFKMSRVASPDGLDEYLDQQGYERETPTNVLIYHLNEPITEVNGQVKNKLSDEWLYYLLKFTSRPVSERQIITDTLTRIIPPACFASISHGQDVLAVGRAAYDEGTLGIFDVAVAQNQRQKGLGTQMMRTLLHWGQQHGARLVYLQVVPSNIAATRLYDRLGFELAYQYWYRIEPDKA